MSTITQLTETVHELASVINTRGQTDVVYLDFSKAFDRVPHEKLLTKLAVVLNNTNILRWLESYLTLRQQFVQFDSACSGTTHVTSGVPQGSVLGPLLFLIFVNDIVCEIPVKIRLFADDCVVFKEIKSLGDCEVLNSSLERLSKWCADWQMSLNLSKTVCMSITRKKSPLLFNYSIGNYSLLRVSSYKYLGLTITSDLRWNTHVSNICSRAMSKLGFLRRYMKHGSRETKLLLYKTLVRPMLEYASVIWDPHTSCCISELERIQRLAVRFVYNMYSSYVSPTKLCTEAGLETLQERRRMNRLKFLYLIVNDELGIDKDDYITFFCPRSTRHFHSRTIKPYSYKNDAFKYSFFPRTIIDWNSLPPDVVNTTNFLDFCSKLLQQAQPV